MFSLLDQQAQRSLPGLCKELGTWRVVHQSLGLHEVSHLRPQTPSEGELRMRHLTHHLAEQERQGWLREL